MALCRESRRVTGSFSMFLYVCNCVRLLHITIRCKAVGQSHTACILSLLFIIKSADLFGFIPL